MFASVPVYSSSDANTNANGSRGGRGEGEVVDRADAPFGAEAAAQDDAEAGGFAAVEGGEGVDAAAAVGPPPGRDERWEGATGTPPALCP
ncbi:hypothetical protein Slala02_50690 [Streptomyces lavendulae subsp. lavendulae]|nr:hypothetical protein Slala01_24730 [Streptomyces lavendulae subsp. lavendulae]GLX29249.1 hypothetical protein Slala02_50690 [Streptomyces lavendulae subsp. lavendulae]